MSEENKTTSSDFLALAIKKELASINTYLSVAGIKQDVDGTIDKEQLDRKVAEDVERKEISLAMTQNSPSFLSAAVRVAREANRARRDINIIEASHKKLMLGIYRTMYQRKLKLERKLEDEIYA